MKNRFLLAVICIGLAPLSMSQLIDVLWQRSTGVWSRPTVSADLRTVVSVDLVLDGGQGKSIFMARAPNYDADRIYTISEGQVWSASVNPDGQSYVAVVILSDNSRRLEHRTLDGQLLKSLPSPEQLRSSSPVARTSPWSVGTTP